MRTRPVLDSLHDQFSYRAQQSPDAVAVSLGEETVSYSELESWSNAIAHELLEYGLEADALVGLFVDRSIELIAGMLGILKAGAAYVPIDPGYPEKRISFLLQDSGISLLVTRTGVRLPRSAAAAEILVADNFRQGTPEIPQPQSRVQETSLAYVIYTSGTTGVPNGVLIEHRNILDLFRNTDSLFGFNERDTWCLFHSPSFDFSTWEIWGALLFGGRLVIVPQDIGRIPQAFRRLILDEKITVLNQTPSAFIELQRVELKARESGDQDGSYCLRYIIFGGEKLAMSSLAPWIHHYGDDNPQLVNMYGITETTVHTSYYQILESSVSDDTDSPIGRALPRVEVVLINESGEQADTGEEGEIFVTGSGVARSYLNRPELTAQRFLQLNVGGTEKRYYRSGDSAVRHADGTLYYRGRIDSQVKVRGYRVEVAEIEQHLESHPAVARAAVVEKTYADNDSRLIAFIVPDALDDSFGELQEGLRNLLSENLPEYMWPSQYCQLGSLPITSHGKLDRQSLLGQLEEPSPEHGSETCQSCGADDEVETAIQDTIRDILKCQEVSRDIDIFDLGATSLAVLRVLTSVSEQFSVEITVEDLIDGITVKNLARCVSRLRAPLASRSFESLAVNEVESA